MYCKLKTMFYLHDYFKLMTGKRRKKWHRVYSWHATYYKSTYILYFHLLVFLPPVTIGETLIWVTKIIINRVKYRLWNWSRNNCVGFYCYTKQQWEKKDKRNCRLFNYQHDKQSVKNQNFNWCKQSPVSQPASQIPNLGKISHYTKSTLHITFFFKDYIFSWLNLLSFFSFKKVPKIYKQ